MSPHTENTTPQTENSTPTRDHGCPMTQNPWYARYGPCPPPHHNGHNGYHGPHFGHGGHFPGHHPFHGNHFPFHGNHFHGFGPWNRHHHHGNSCGQSDMKDTVNCPMKEKHHHGFSRPPPCYYGYHSSGGHMRPWGRQREVSIVEAGDPFLIAIF